MCIEHRWASRQPAVLPVSLACRSLGLVRGSLRNISNGGALVQVSRPLPPHVPVEVILPVHSGPSAQPYRFTAIVTRCGKEGVGLMFDRVAPDAWMALLSQLAPPRAAGSAASGEATVHGATI